MSLNRRLYRLSHILTGKHRDFKPTEHTDYTKWQKITLPAFLPFAFWRHSAFLALATENPALVRIWKRDRNETGADAIRQQEEEKREWLGCFPFDHERSAQLLATD